jgi:hypothetical protein
MTEAQVDHNDAKWNKTSEVFSRLEKDGKLEIIEGKKSYKVRPIIQRNSKINGGVYLSSHKREAIVVDFEESTNLQYLYTDVLKAASKNGVVQKDKLLEAVYDTVAQAMTENDLEKIQDIVKTKYGANKDGKISLGVFLKEGMGVCTHKALACGSMIEKLIDDGYLAGKVSVDRNSMLYGGHAWCRYTDAKGTVFIIDVAQHYLGKLKNANPEHEWAYRRPDDI